MSIFGMAPIVNADDLADAVNVQFNCDVGDIRDLLFSDGYDIYSARSFCFDEMENGEDEDVVLRNLVRTYLQDALLGYEFVMIDLG